MRKRQFNRAYRVPKRMSDIRRIKQLDKEYKERFAMNLNRFEEFDLTPCWKRIKNFLAQVFEE